MFKVKDKKTTWKREIMAGISTFLTMAYILFLNPQILSQTGMEFSAVMFATAVTAGFGCLLMGFIANYPFAIATGLGLNAYFAYTVVISQGHTWQAGLAACCLSGVILLILNILGFRQLVMQIIPKPLQFGISAGIGLFLALIGIKNIGDINIITLYVAIALISVMVLLYYGYPSSIFLSVIILWVIGVVSGHASFEGIIALPPNPTPTLMQLDFSALSNPSLWSVIFTLVFVNLFDVTGALIALGQQGGFLDNKGHLPNARRALSVDAIMTTVGAFLGTSNTTVYLESASGITSGGRTGLTAITTGILFFCSLFFSPLAASIPLYATTPVLIIIGFMMLKPLKHLHWKDMTEVIPAYLILITIPLTFNIADGISIGLLAYVIIKIGVGKYKDVHVLTYLLTFLCLLRYVAFTI